MTINVTKPFLPDLDIYNGYLKGIWQRNWLTNRGPLVCELEEKLKEHLQLNHLLFVSNGTIALQIAIKALNLTGEIITTPFSYVATTNSILWENCRPVFADIDPQNFCIDADLLEQHITVNTSAILATHVFGYPCEVEKIKAIADKHGLKIIYDAAHAFGVNYKGKSIFNYGDISTCSFHATKVFHTGEGGAIISNNIELNEKIFRYHAFGHEGDTYYSIGVNGKNSELHAAMGLSVLPSMKQIISARKNISECYDKLLNSVILRPQIPTGINYNYSYYPVLFKNEEMLLKVKRILAGNEINTRRYFFPSLNTLHFLSDIAVCPVSENIASRVLCLPLYSGLDLSDVERIAMLINKSI